MTDPVHIVATGARTPVGLTAESVAAAVRARVSRLGEYPFLVGVPGEALKAARDARLAVTVPILTRMVEMARHAIDEVAGRLMARAGRSLDVQVLLALPEARPGLDPSYANWIAQEIATTEFPGITVAGIRWSVEGHASAMRALAVAPSTLAQGAGVTVICAVDSYLDARTLDALDANRRLSREGIRDGFSPGEGAAAIAIASDDARVRFGFPSLAVLRGVSLAYEERSPDDPIGLLGEGLTRAVTEACAGLRAPDERVDEIFCDLNGERHRSDEWGFTLLRAPGLFRDGTDYRTVADACGDVGAASAALGCVLAVEAWQRGYAKGPVSLVWASSNGALRGAALLERSGYGG